MAFDRALREMAKSLRDIAGRMEELAGEHRPAFPLSHLQLDILLTLVEAKSKGEDALSSRDIADIITRKRERRLGSAQSASRTFGASVARATKYLVATEMVKSAKIGRRVLYSLGNDVVGLSGEGENLQDAFSNIVLPRKVIGRRRSEAWVVLETDASLSSQGFPNRESVLDKVCELLKAAGLGSGRPSRVLIPEFLGTLPKNAVHIVATLTHSQEKQTRRRRPRKTRTTDTPQGEERSS